MHRSIVVFSRFAWTATCLVFFGCTLLSGTGQQLVNAPVPVYIQDFQLNVAAFHAESGVLPIAPRPLRSMLPRVLGVPDDPAMRAHELVELMASSLVAELTELGVDARRVSVGEQLPAQGWLVRGSFTELDEGNRLFRAVIGLGTGRVRLQVFVFLDELSRREVDPAYSLNTSTTSGRAPGALFKLNPLSAAAQFVLCGLDLDNG